MAEEIIQNDMTIHGLRRLHILSSGVPVDREAWCRAVRLNFPEHAKSTCITTFTQDEPKLGIFHLWLYWKVDPKTLADNNAKIRPSILQELKNGHRK